MSENFDYRYSLLLRLILLVGFLLFVILLVGFCWAMMKDFDFNEWIESSKAWYIKLYMSVGMLSFSSMMLYFVIYGFKASFHPFRKLHLDMNQKIMQITYVNQTTKIHFDDIIKVIDQPRQSILVIQSKYQHFQIPPLATGYAHLYYVLYQQKLIDLNSIEGRKTSLRKHLNLFISLLLPFILLPLLFIGHLIEAYANTTYSFLGFILIPIYLVFILIVFAQLTTRFVFSEDGLVAQNMVESRKVLYEDIKKMSLDIYHKKLIIKLKNSKPWWQFGWDSLFFGRKITIYEPYNMSLEQIVIELSEKVDALKKNNHTENTSS